MQGAAHQHRRGAPGGRRRSAKGCALVIGGEIAFWVLLDAGLAVRHLLRRSRAGAVVLLCVPLVDVVLPAAAVADLRAGGPRPQGPPKYGTARAAHAWRMCGRTAPAEVVAAVLLRCAVRLVGDADRTEALRQWRLRTARVAGLNAAVTAAYTLWPRREPVTGPRG